MRRLFAGLVVVSALIGFGSQLHANPLKKLTNKPVPVKTVTEGVQMRAAANENAEVIATLPKGENLTALSRSGAYWKVKNSAGKEGFVPVASVQTKAGTNAIKAAAGDASSQAKEAAAAVQSVVGEKAAEAKQKPAPEVKAPEVKADSLEKAANKFLNKK
jgi:hypothetical protein